jgi:uncharacterized protein (TIGR03437 family)
LAQPDRIAARIDNNQSVVLTGRVPRQATATRDAGPVDGSFQLPMVSLILKPTAAQQADLNQLLQAQRDSTSSSFRQWLTPEQYADRFGVSASDLAQITAWLEAQGFSVSYQARARNFVAFSGTAQQVSIAFHTGIHTYTVNGETHYANATDPSIPAALAGIVSGVRGLNDFRLKPRIRKAQPRTTVGNQIYVGPTDYATIYDVTPLYTESVNGTLINGAGQKIAIVGQSEIYTSDIAKFRSHFGLAASTPTLLRVPYSSAYPDGGNPGYVGGDELESDLDVEWAGAVAPSATVVFVYSGDVWTSAQYVIDQNVAPVLSMSYGSCEEYDLVDLDWQRSYAQQGSAEGITFLAAAGDSGAADCDNGNPTNEPAPSLAEGGLAVDTPGSFPEVTAMGGTQFAESSKYWSNGAAVGYIPESVWNDSSLGVLGGGGGGESAYFTQPPWQNGIAPNDGMRHVPDLSSASSDYYAPFYMYTSDDTFGAVGAIGIGGTSCAAPSMAGIVALLNQYLVATGTIKQAGLGNINPTLYRLSQTQSGAFHDIVNGSNIQPCADSPDCVNGYLGWSATSGYDSASGLGSVDAYKLVHAWSTAVATQPLVVASLDSTPEYETSGGAWTFTLTLTEEAGFATTLTGLAINGVTLTTAQIQSLFGTMAIPAHGSISGSYTLRGLDVSSGTANVGFTFSGATGSATWTNSMTAPFAGTQPLWAVGGISNAASGQVAFAPGMLISLYGTGLANFVQSATIAPLPEYMAGFEAYAADAYNNSDAVPLLYVGSNQVNMQIPYELAVGPGATLQVGNPYTYQNISFTLSAAAPGIFTYADSSTTRSPIGSGSARVGQTVSIYITGAGQVSPLPGPTNQGTPDGMPPATGTTPKPVQAVSITVGGVAVTSILYDAIPSWSVGVVQINFVIPSGVPVGQQPVVVTVGGVASLPANIAITQ